MEILLIFGLPGITQIRSEEYSKFIEDRNTHIVEICDHLDVVTVACPQYK